MLSSVGPRQIGQYVKVSVVGQALFGCRGCDGTVGTTIALNDGWLKELLPVQTEISARLGATGNRADQLLDAREILGAPTLRVGPVVPERYGYSGAVPILQPRGQEVVFWAGNLAKLVTPPGYNV